MQSHLIVDSILLKTYEKDLGDSSSPLLEGRISLVCIEEHLLAVSYTFKSALTNEQIIFKPLDRFFQNLRFSRSQTVVL